MFSKTESVYCPVCLYDGGKLGNRHPEDYFEGYCGDCRATYYYSPGKKIPYKVLTDRQKKNICKCPTCAGKVS